MKGDVAAQERRSDALRPLSDSLTGRFNRQPGTARTHAPRELARDLGVAVATQLDSYWPSAQGADEGPVDVIDVFSGCGGMSTGFKTVNSAIPAFRLAAAVDIDDDANKSFEANLRIAPARLDAARIASQKDLLDQLSSTRRRGTPLVLIGCAPCQGFSSHRNGAGVADPRNSLFGDFAAIASQLMPDAVVIENVPELLTDRYWGAVEHVRSTLEDSGYYVHLAVHNMAEFGVPQERFRALMVAMRQPFVPPWGFLPRGQFKTVRDAIGALPEVEAGVRCSNDEMHYSAGHRQSTLETIRAVRKDGGSRPAHVGPDCLRRAAQRNGKPAYEDVYGRLFWDRPSITITAYARNPASGRFVHPEQHRGLTVREAALLQGFPRRYWFDGSLDSRFRQIGNAVPPAFAAFLASHILGELLSEPLADEEFDPGLQASVGSSFSRLIPGLKAAGSCSRLSDRLN